MRRWVTAVAAVTAGGRFVSVWSVVLALPLSLTVMSSPSTAAPLSSRLLAGLATWGCFAAALLAIGAFERRASTPRRRRGVVAGGVLTVAAVRPFVQDAWLAAFGGSPPPLAELPFRIATNLVVWAVVLTSVALIVGALRSVRETNALLRGVLAEIDAAHARAADAARAGRDAVRDAVAGIDRELRRLPAEAAAVQRLSTEHIRAASHALIALADSPLPPGAAPLGAPRRRLRSMPLRLPPVGVVTALYIACLLPYAARASSPGEIAISVVCAVGGGVCADRLARRRNPRTAMAFFAVMSILIGLVLSVVAGAAGAPLGMAVIPAVAYAALALGASATAGALHMLRVEQRRLTGAVVSEQRTLRAGAEPTRAALRRAAEVLHRDGQGQCTVFVLQHPAPSAADLTGLVDALEGVLRRVTAVFDTPVPTVGASVDTLAATWGRVIDLSMDITQGAATMLRSAPIAARDVYEVAAEGILNAVKHTSEHRAEISVDVIATGAGDRLRVRVRSFGVLPAGTHLRPASHVRTLGARLRGTQGDAVLEAILTPDTATVVSAEHPVSPPISRS